MERTDEERDREGRRTRAERLRQARDARNAELNDAPKGEEEHGGPATGASEGEMNDRTPNYVDLIDRRMRELDDSA